ncbi:MAG: hypothetical protein NT034_04545 [Candidatus Magasanikbacteria bacterium]|nr:hypothetical protein [Candidatus Magasanikbacteria bacterium]
MQPESPYTNSISVAALMDDYFRRRIAPVATSAVQAKKNEKPQKPVLRPPVRHPRRAPQAISSRAR